MLETSAKAIAAGGTAARRRRWGWVVLVVLPVAVVVVTGVVRDAIGPYWLRGNIDPVYGYLMNSLLVATGRPAVHTDHPGTTAQLAGAATIRAMHLVAGSEPLPADALRRPEAYLAAMQAVMMGLFAATLAAGGVVIWRASGSLPAALLLQLSPLLTVRPFVDLAKVKAEPMLMTFATVLATLLALTVLAPQRSSGRGYPVALGAAAGLAMASKVTFAPLLIVPLAVLSGWRRWLAYLAAAAAAFFAVTLPATASVARFFRFFRGVVTHTGAYGAGEEALVSAEMLDDRLPRLLGTILAEEWVFAAIVAVGAAAVIATPLAWRRRAGDASQRTAWRLLALLTAAQLAAIVMVTKSPYTPLRYLVPAFCMLGLDLILIRRLAGSIAQRPTGRLAQAGGALLLAIALVHLVVGVGGEAAELARTRDQALEGARRAAAVASEVPCRLVELPSNSSPPRALDFGNGFAGQRFSKALAELYPDTVLYNQRRRSFTSFGRRVASGDALAAGPLCAFAVPRGLEWPPDVTVQLLTDVRDVVLRFAGQRETAGDGS